ncbi:bifunctional 2-polyprenyl-6-hydroxyphenol methylase/3-demethylubiquinol 3-O-methyltransferase UbiG [Clostridium sp. DJ247]|uniref:class I SAM-dependent methyltransferase n=1 Tax=Clostridium sp. DJ247 TaxID=2726188 RepID=UPI0016262005|nr:class I SAM-dependent methyltransferase [Clostridium sp. DJ247]MBC2580359.1 class I SAM-dependent methyltransferase [Clostridium sp. DJ247]
MQEEHTRVNELAWNQMAYEAWVYRFGSPSEASQKIMSDPTSKLGLLSQYLTDVKNKKIANLLGSHGTKAVSLALMGADVTVIDFSYENSRYALDLARECGVEINYIVSDVLKIPAENITGDYDIVFCELGILHYFIDLNPFFNIASRLLRKGGIFIVEDFHPISTKLITSKGKKHKVTGDYFSKDIEETEVAYMKFVPGFENLTDEEKSSFQKAYLRKWTMGEIITSIANNSLYIKTLEETEGPKPEDKGIPKLFTIVSEKL